MWCLHIQGMSSSRGMDPSTLEEEGKTFLQKHQETLNHQHNGIFQENLKLEFLHA